jgi:hypothetical protein
VSTSPRPGVLAPVCACIALAACMGVGPIDDQGDAGEPLDAGGLADDDAAAGSPGLREAGTVEASGPTDQADAGACALEAGAGVGVGVVGCPCTQIDAVACVTSDSTATLVCAPPAPVVGTTYLGSSVLRWESGLACSVGGSCDPLPGPNQGTCAYVNEEVDASGSAEASTSAPPPCIGTADCIPGAICCYGAGISQCESGGPCKWQVCTSTSECIVAGDVCDLPPAGFPVAPALPTLLICEPAGVSGTDASDAEISDGDGSAGATSGGDAADDAGTDEAPETGPGGCVPKTCAQLGYNCGYNGNNCGGVLDCGTCTSPQFCGGGGFSTCGPTPDAG